MPPWELRYGCTCMRAGFLSMRSSISKRRSGFSRSFPGLPGLPAPQPRKPNIRNSSVLNSPDHEQVGLMRACMHSVSDCVGCYCESAC